VRAGPCFAVPNIASSFSGFFASLATLGDEVGTVRQRRLVASSESESKPTATGPSWRGHCVELGLRRHGADRRRGHEEREVRRHRSRRTRDPSRVPGCERQRIGCAVKLLATSVRERPAARRSSRTSVRSNRFRRGRGRPRRLPQAYAQGRARSVDCARRGATAPRSSAARRPACTFPGTSRLTTHDRCVLVTTPTCACGASCRPATCRGRARATFQAREGREGGPRTHSHNGCRTGRPRPPLVAPSG
jgi:hypothetical protein